MKDGDRLMTTREVADYTRFSQSTLAQWRVYGEGPRHVKLGTRAVRYRKADVDDWVNDHFEDAT